MSNNRAEKAFQAIKETFGYGRVGTHKKKCDICGTTYDESNDLDDLIIAGPAKCPCCKEITDLREELVKHADKFWEAETKNSVKQNNMIKEIVPSCCQDLSSVGGVITESYIEAQHSITYRVEGRTKRVKDFIQRIAEARRYLYEVIEPHMEILESIFERKDLLWDYGGNLGGYVEVASVQLVVIRLKEYLSKSSDSRFSIYKIKNIINTSKKAFFDDHRIIKVKTYVESGDKMETPFPHFEIDKYLDKLNNVLVSYEKVVNAISDYRDTQFAHIDKLKNPEESRKALTFVNLKRVFNSLKIIYDGLLYSVAPDLFTRLVYNHNLKFNVINSYIEAGLKSTNDQNQ